MKRIAHINDQSHTSGVYLSRPAGIAGVKRLVILSACLAAIPAAQAQQVDGERLFRQRCASCHSIEPGRNGVGPHLADVIGRSAGTVEGARYSNAMRNAAIVWSPDTLDTYLASPRQAIPGSRMTVSIPDAEQRSAIIRYLETLSSDKGATP